MYVIKYRANKTIVVVVVGLRSPRESVNKVPKLFFVVSKHFQFSLF